MNIELAATGERPVQLTIRLQVSSNGRGGTRVAGNEATLSDAAGAQLCQGQLTAFDNSGFSAHCQGPGGGSSGTNLTISGTITGSTASQVEGDLQVAPSGG